jgi:hypothetical protein
MATPISPDSRNRSDSAISGGASATIIRAEVKADDHISAKASPIRIARMSMPARPVRSRGRAPGYAARPCKKAATGCILRGPVRPGGARSAVDAVLERLGDGDLDHLVGRLLDLLARGGVAHHTLGRARQAILPTPGRVTAPPFEPRASRSLQARRVRRWRSSCRFPCSRPVRPPAGSWSSVWTFLVSSSPPCLMRAHPFALLRHSAAFCAADTIH